MVFGTEIVAPRRLQRMELGKIGERPHQVAHGQTKNERRPPHGAVRRRRRHPQHAAERRSDDKHYDNGPPAVSITSKCDWHQVSAGFSGYLPTHCLLEVGVYGGG